MEVGNKSVVDTPPEPPGPPAPPTPPGLSTGQDEVELSKSQSPHLKMELDNLHRSGYIMVSFLRGSPGRKGHWAVYHTSPQSL